MIKFKHIYHFILFASLIALTISCDNDDDVNPIIDDSTYEGTFNINPNNFPAGAGLDLSAGDTGRVAQLDEIANFEWDIKMITYKTAQGGRPGILLYGDDRNASAAAQGINVSEAFGVSNGSTGFDSFNNVTEAMQQALSPDGEFLFDPVLDSDPQGRADIAILEAAYQDLVIGDRIVNLDEVNQPVYLIKDRSGNLYKFQMIERAQGGVTMLRWARFGASAIE